MIMSSSKVLGVLSLQGNFEEHKRLLSRLKAHVVLVTSEKDLQKVEGLVIPGGESTVMSSMIEKRGLREPLVDFSKTHPILGTCAGLILMSSCVMNGDQKDRNVFPLNILPLSVKRNAYGPQVYSGFQTITLNPDEFSENTHLTPLKGLFIRAPLITQRDEKIQVLAKRDGIACAVRYKNCIGLSFHPESSDMDLFHRLLFF